MAQGAMDLNAALAPGLPGAVDVNQAINQAIAFWNNMAANAYNTMEASALDEATGQATAALALLNQQLTYIQNPSGNTSPAS